jgi:hypothetical protein
MNIRFSRHRMAASAARPGCQADRASQARRQAGPAARQDGGADRARRPYRGLAFGAAVLASAGAVALAGCGSIAAPGSGSAGTGSAGSGSAGAGSAAGSAARVSASSPASTGAPASTAAGQALLCASAGRVTRMVVVRSHLINRVQILHFPFPHVVTVTDAARARAVAAALCALPAMPGGVVNCPNMMFGTSYRLTFTLAGKPLPVVTVNGTGCQTVTGAGPVRRVSTTPGFWRVLGNAIGLFGAGPPVFSGHGPRLAQCRPAATDGGVPVDGCPGIMRPLSSRPGPMS